MRATRDARPVVPSPPCAICTHDHCECLRRQVNYDAAVEAVVEAARAAAEHGINHIVVDADESYDWVDSVQALADALARLDALTDGQGSNAAVTDSESSPCPCDGTDCVC